MNARNYTLYYGKLYEKVKELGHIYYPTILLTIKKYGIILHLHHNALDSR